MSALPYQPVPTASQQRELERWVQKKFPVNQYRDNQDEAIAEMQAERIRYELARAERAEQEVRAEHAPTEMAAAGVACCVTDGDDEDTELTWPSLILAVAASLILWAFIGWACAPFVAPFIASLQRIAP